MTEVEDILKVIGTFEPMSLAEVNPIDVDAELALRGRRFSFEVETDEQAQAAASTLRVFGMTGPTNAAKAFVDAMAAAGKGRR